MDGGRIEQPHEKQTGTIPLQVKEAGFMSELSNRAGNDNAPERIVTRDGGTTAPGRCIMYAVFSDVAASPFDAEPAVAGEPIDIAELGLPYELNDFEPLLQRWREADKEQLKREYSSLFEVGSDGPPVPIREDLHRNQPAGVREDIVRFYEFFGYGLAESFQWSPDHLSIELEFMHFLCYQEAEQSSQPDGDAVSFQLAQSDFSERHLMTWVSSLAHRVNEKSPDGIYANLLAAMSEFLVKDFEWQAATIES
jgi:DMSO reductase family type II enzyme chaperone